MKKKIVAVLSCVAVLVGVVTFAFAYGEYGVVQAELAPHFKILMDGTEITYTDITGKTVTPIVVEGTTYLPLRGVCESVGKDVDWDENTKTITITTPRSIPVHPSVLKIEPLEDTYISDSEIYYKVEKQSEYKATISAIKNGIKYTSEIELNQKIYNYYVKFLADGNGYVCFDCEFGDHVSFALVDEQIVEVGTTFFM